MSTSERDHIRMDVVRHLGVPSRGKPTCATMTTDPIVEHDPAGEPASSATDEQLIAVLVDRARGDGLRLTGGGGLLQKLTKRVLESALKGEITDHVGYDKHDPQGRGSGNSRNGHRAKTVLTDVGPVEVRVPRDVAFDVEIRKVICSAGTLGCCSCSSPTCPGNPILRTQPSRPVAPTS